MSHSDVDARGDIARPTTPTVIYIHLPKAGGTTIRSVVERQYDAEVFRFTDQADFDFVETIEAIPEARRHLMRCFFGHMRFGLHEYLSQPSTYVTMLRSPLDRVLSYYYYLRQQPDHPLHDMVRSRRLTVDDCLRSAIFTELNDGQVRLLCGFVDGSTVPFGATTGAMLAAAKANLRTHFSGVGIAEEFDASLLLLGRQFGWDDLYYRKLNVTTGRPRIGDIGKSVRAAIEKHNGLDLELYEYARALFREMADRERITRASVLAFRADQCRFWTLRTLRKRKNRIGEAIETSVIGRALSKLRDTCTRKRVGIPAVLASWHSMADWLSGG